jgi:hypothetical protein
MLPHLTPAPFLSRATCGMTRLLTPPRNAIWSYAKMAKVSEMIISKFLRKEDVDDDLIVTLKNCRLEDMPGESKEQRWVLYFRELPKGLVLNTTIIRVLEKNFGDDSDEWAGKKVTLFVDENVTFKGAIVGGLRLRVQKAPKQSPLVPVSGAPAAPEFDDQIP